MALFIEREEWVSDNYDAEVRVELVKIKINFLNLIFYFKDIIYLKTIYLHINFVSNQLGFCLAFFGSETFKLFQ